MKTLNISVSDKVATYRQRDGAIVCGNSDYQIKFTFDSEWDAYTEKTARFIWNGRYVDVDFTDDICPVPIVHNADKVQVGVYAGELSTTTPAVIECKKSILCENADVSAEARKEYADEAKLAADRAEEAADRAESSAPYIGENGNWWVLGVDTGVFAAGEGGKDGVGIDRIELMATDTDAEGRVRNHYDVYGTNGTVIRSFTITDGKDGTDGVDGKDGKDGVGIESIYEGSAPAGIHDITVVLTNGEIKIFTILDGADGLTPYIGDNGNWWIGNTDTGVSAGGGESGGSDSNTVIETANISRNSGDVTTELFDMPQGVTRIKVTGSAGSYYHPHFVLVNSSNKIVESHALTETSDSSNDNILLDVTVEDYTDTVKYGVISNWENASLECDSTTSFNLDLEFFGEKAADTPATPDWNANEGEDGHILNRTHWKDVISAGGEIYSGNSSEWIVPEDSETLGIQNDALSTISEGKSYTVTWNGTSYKCVAFDAGENGIILGNLGVIDETLIGEEPFVIACVPAEMAAEIGANAGVIPLDGSTDITLTIEEDENAIYHKIPKEYIPMEDIRTIVQEELGVIENGSY